MGTWYGAFRAAALAHYVDSELNRAGTLTELVPRSQATIVYDRHGNPAFTFFVEQRIDVPLDRVSPHMLAAIVAVEDRRFFSHHGIDPLRISAPPGATSAPAGSSRAAARSRSSSPGSRSSRPCAHTSGRFARSCSPRGSKSATRSRRFSRSTSTRSISARVTTASRRRRGDTSASRPSTCNLHEAALLAALVRSPSKDAPCVNPARALKRRNLVLRLMREQGGISDDTFRVASATSIPDRSHQRPPPASRGERLGVGPVFPGRSAAAARSRCSGPRRSSVAGCASTPPTIRRCSVHAESAVTTRIAQIVKARPAARDLQGSLVAMDPVTGEVRALVGGRDFKASSFNRATQARRQAGSAFKPIIYAAALERGYAPGTILRDLDAPIRLPVTRRPGCQPASTSDPVHAAARAEGLEQPRRCAAAPAGRCQHGRVLRAAPRHRVGAADGAVARARHRRSDAAGAHDGIHGASPITGWSRVRVSSRGSRTPRVSRSGDAPERRTQAISPTTAYLMSSMLADVISGGTATTRARTAGFKLPAAGKTGTTDEYADAWFVGYTPHLVTGVWFGLDKPAPIMRGGFAGVVAVPAWAQLHARGDRGDAADWYETPADVEKVTICRLSGARATDACRHPAEAYSVSAEGTAVGTGRCDARRGRGAAGPDSCRGRVGRLRGSASLSVRCRASSVRCTTPAPMCSRRIPVQQRQRIPARPRSPRIQHDPDGRFNPADIRCHARADGRVSDHGDTPRVERHRPRARPRPGRGHEDGHEAETVSHDFRNPVKKHPVCPPSDGPVMVRLKPDTTACLVRLKPEGPEIFQRPWRASPRKKRSSREHERQ